MIIHLTRPARGTNARRIFIRRGATVPEDFIGPAALPLFCLAPHDPMNDRSGENNSGTWENRRDGAD